MSAPRWPRRMRSWPWRATCETRWPGASGSASSRRSRPNLLPLVFAPLREALPALEVEPWEDQTAALLERLRAHELDAVLLATEVDGPDLVSQPLFAEPFLAALPREHPLAAREVVAEEQLAEDILVLADGHCLREQALAACGRSGALDGTLRAAGLPTLL